MTRFQSPLRISDLKSSNGTLSSPSLAIGSSIFSVPCSDFF